jgi:hypothetical protein
MERAANRARTIMNLERGFEGSRLEGQLVAAAYELVAPIIRRSLPSAHPPSRRSSARAAGDNHQRRAQGG